MSNVCPNVLPTCAVGIAPARNPVEMLFQSIAATVYQDRFVHDEGD